MTVEILNPTTLIKWLAFEPSPIRTTSKRSLLSKSVHLALTAVATLFAIMAKNQSLPLRVLPFPLILISFFFSKKQVTILPASEDPIQKAFLNIMNALKGHKIAYHQFDKHEQGQELQMFEGNKVSALFGKKLTFDKKRYIPFVIMRFCKSEINRCRIILSEDPNCPGKLKLQVSPLPNNESMVNDLAKEHLPSFEGEINWSLYSFIQPLHQKIATFQGQQQTKKYVYHHIDEKIVDELCLLIGNVKPDSWLLQRTWY